MTVGASENGRKYTLTALLESLNAMPPIIFNEEKNHEHELFMEYLTQFFKFSKLDEEDAYEFFYHMHPDLDSAVFHTDVINGSILFLRKFGSLVGADLPFFDDRKKHLSFFIKDNDATFITRGIVIFIKEFHNPISKISIKNYNAEALKLKNMNYMQCKFTLEILMKCIATLLTWQYKKSNIDRRVKPVGGENE